MKKKSLERGAGGDPHIRPPNPRVFAKISLLHLACRPSAASAQHPSPASRSSTSCPLPSGRPLFISERPPPWGLLSHSSLSWPQRPPRYTLFPYFDASPQGPLRVLPLSSRDIPGSAPSKAPLLSTLPPPQRPSFTPARAPQRLLLRQLLVSALFGLRPLTRSPAPRSQPRPEPTSGPPLGPAPRPRPAHRGAAPSSLKSPRPARAQTRASLRQSSWCATRGPRVSAFWFRVEFLRAGKPAWAGGRKGFNLKTSGRLWVRAEFVAKRETCEESEGKRPGSLPW